MVLQISLQMKNGTQKCSPTLWSHSICLLTNFCRITTTVALGRPRIFAYTWHHLAFLEACGFSIDNLRWKDTAPKTGRPVKHFSKLRIIIPRLLNGVTMKKIRWWYRLCHSAIHYLTYTWFITAIHSVEVLMCYTWHLQSHLFLPAEDVWAVLIFKEADKVYKG